MEGYHWFKSIVILRVISKAVCVCVLAEIEKPMCKCVCVCVCALRKDRMVICFGSLINTQRDGTVPDASGVV